MKKYISLCGMMLLCFDMMAQIDLSDKNWDTLFIEDFSVQRNWSEDCWIDECDDPNHIPFWRCYTYECWPSGVVVDARWHRQAYQPEEAVFAPDSTLRLLGVFKGPTSLLCNTGYRHAPWACTNHSCGQNPEPPHNVFYHTGMIESIEPVGFGYYEIKCKMPTHKGAGSSFWFWGNEAGLYEEIDVFEHRYGLSEGDTLRAWNSCIWYNPDGPDIGQMYSRVLYHLPVASQPVDEYHTYGLLWLPDRVAWYCDGALYNECTDPSQIPQHRMYLRITHKEDWDAFDSISNKWWSEPDEMTIKYVKAFQLETSCDTDVTVRSIPDFESFDFNVKRSISMGALTGTLSISANASFTMRAVESIVIDGAFELPQGATMTLITQECPQNPLIQKGTHNY